MINDKKLNQLKEFGLNSYEIRIWIALLSKGSATAGEISSISAVPRSRCYDVLESLEKKGFVISEIGKPQKYLPTSPEEVIERLKKKAIQEAQRNIEDLEKFKESNLNHELKTLYEKSIKNIDPLEFSGALRGKENIFDHVKQLIRSSKKSIKIITTEKPLIEEINTLAHGFKTAKDRGVEIKIAAPITPLTKEYVNLIKDYVVFKDSKNISSRFSLFDNEDALLFITPDTSNILTDSAIWVKSPQLYNSLENAFEQIWKTI